MKKIIQQFFTFFIIFFLIISSNFLAAQEFGGFPPAKKWRIAKSNTIRVIYPKGLDSIAKEILFTTASFSKKSNYSLVNKDFKSYFVLQNQHVVANGYAGLGPQRSELYLTPPSNNFDLGTASWTQQLAIHEYRHIQQYNSLKNGISKWAYKIFGDDVFDAAVNIVIPNWYFEGEAVFAETRFTHQGRGQMPSFLKRIPALWQANKNYSWMKLRNGSLKDYVPNHYDVGYQLIQYGYNNFGENFWKNITKEATQYKGIFYPFQKAIYKNTGLTYKQFRKNALDSLHVVYQKNNLLQNEEMAKDRISKQYSVFTNYLQPTFINDSILFIKESFKRSPYFALLHNGKEKKLAAKHISTESSYSYNNGKIVYTTYSKNPRWNWITYSDITLLDLTNLKQKKITHGGKYFSPAISFDGSKIIVGQFSDKSIASLVLLKTSTGKKLKEFTIPKAIYYSHPKFLNDSTIIATARHADGQTALITFDITTSSSKNILPKTNRIIGDISVLGNMVYFTISDSLQDKIGRYKFGDSTVSVLKTKDMASYMPSASTNQLIRTVFSANGYFLKSSKLENLDWAQLSFNEYAQDTYFKNRIQKHIIQPQSVNFTDTTFHSLKNIFNFHSWRPHYIAPLYSVTAYGNNLLNTTTTELQYTFNENEKSHTMGGSFIYGGLYPLINLAANYTFHRYLIVDSLKHHFNQSDIQLGFSIPFSFIKKNNYSSFLLQNSIHNKQLFFNDNTPKKVMPQHWYLVHKIQYSTQKQAAKMQIFPQWALYSSLQFRHTLSKKPYSQLLAQLSLHVPALSNTHSIQLNHVAQINNNSTNFFASRLPFARGYESFNTKSSFTHSFNYHLPLCYPDWGFANIFYVQRVRANVFYDNTFTSNKMMKHNSSAGVEMYADTKWWNQHPLSFGIRCGYTLHSKKMFYEAILPVAYF